MISKIQTKETPFIIQHGYVDRRAGYPTDDVDMLEADGEPGEYYIDGYASTVEEAKSLAEACYRSCKDDEANFGVWFDISKASNWNDDLGEFVDYDCVEVIDFWMEDLLKEQSKNKEAIAKVMMKVIDLINPADKSIVLLRALRECMTNSVVGMMVNRDEIVSYVYDEDNWPDDGVYDPEGAMRRFDVVRKKALGSSAKDFFEEEA